MRKFLNKTIFLITAATLLISLTSCGESEAEKSARKQKESDAEASKIFHRIKPKGNNPGY